MSDAIPVQFNCQYKSTTTTNDRHNGHRNDKLIHQLFEGQRKQTPDEIAIIFGDNKLTYEELGQKADNLAAAILAASPASIIAGVSAVRGIETIVSVLAILKSGKAYLPLDPDYPQDRLQQIITDSGTDLCLTISSQKHLFEPLSINVLISDAVYETGNKPISVRKSACYVLYTSGSTGTPKGVSMGHAAMANLLSWQQKYSISTTGVNTLQFAPLSFDVSFQEIFATLTTGGTLVLVDDNLRVDPNRLLRYIEEESVSRIFLPFVVLQYLTEAADAEKYFPACLKEVMTAGEQLKITPQIARFFSALPECKLFNQYGPTETHVVTQLILDGDPAQWPSLPTIGVPIDETEIVILDEELKKLPDGETGELCVSGISLANGYLNRPEMTAEKFVEWKESENKTTRIYRTGDLARYMPDGNIEYLGRRDTQVKIAGNRVELGEIEVLINRLNDIQQAIVVAREDVPGLKRLVAYLVSTKNKPDTDYIRKSIEQQLPDFMHPSAYVWLSELPKTTSGKVDRKNLPKPDYNLVGRVGKYIAPRTEIEKLVAGIWEESMGIEKISVSDNFFSIGGRSLVAIQIMSRIEKATGKRLPLATLLEYSTIEKLSLCLTDDSKPTATSSLVPIQPNGSKLPLYIVHGDGLNVLVFNNLAINMDKEQPVYGLEAQGLKGTDEPSDVMEEIARHYIAEIIAQNPTGPYLLAGYSFGGYIAMEMHKQLAVIGKEVKMLIMFDTDAEKSEYKSWRYLLPKKVKRHFPKLMSFLKSLLRQPVTTVKDSSRIIFQKISLKFNSKRDTKSFYQQIKKINDKHLVAFKNYSMEPINETIHLFKAKICTHYVDDTDFLGWKKYTTKGVELYEVPGDHLSMLVSPNVEEFASILQRSIDQCSLKNL